MENLKDLLNELYKVSRETKRISKAANFEEYEDLSGLQIDFDDPEQVFLQEELRQIMDKLDDASRSIDYLCRPIKGEYTLHKNSRGRYETREREYTSGSGIECLVYDNFYERYSWIYSRIEHDGNDYYLVGHRETPLEGLKVRVRG